ncbi:MAG TPA: hypothetical protein VEI97_13515 [bacterium]|nr:hypothetical protein [bacterium]
MADFACTVIGNTLGALLTAALAARRGMEVCLVIAGHEGFDDSFTARDVLLEGGLLLSDAGNPEGPVRRVADELGLDLETIPLARPTRFHTDRGSIRLGPTFEAMAEDLGRLFPDDRGKLQGLVANLTDWFFRWESGAVERGHADPDPGALGHGVFASLTFSGNYAVSRRFFAQRRLAALARTPFAAELDRAALRPDHRLWWEALLALRTGHLPLALDCLTVAQVVGRDLRGVGAVAGGLDPLRRQAINALFLNPRCRVVAGAVEGLWFMENAPVQVRVEDAGEWTSEQVVCDRGPLMWEAAPAGDGIQLTSRPWAQRFPLMVGVLAALAHSPYDRVPSSQDWWVPRLDLPPTGPNGFWITHLPRGATLPNPPGIHAVTVHGAYLQSQLLDPHGRLYPEDDLVRRLWSAAQHRDEALQLPLEAFHAVVPQRVAPLTEQQTLLPDPREAVAGFLQPHRLGPVPRCRWLDRTQHPPHDLRQEFALARRTADVLLAPTAWERVATEVRAILTPLVVGERETLLQAEVPAREFEVPVSVHASSGEAEESVGALEVPAAGTLDMVKATEVPAVPPEEIDLLDSSSEETGPAGQSPTQPGSEEEVRPAP